MDPWPLELWAQLDEEDSPARGIFYMWLPPAADLLPGFSLMAGRAGCVRPMLPEREAWISLRIHRDDSSLLQDFYYLLAVTQFLITGQQRLSGMAAGAVRGTASGNMWIPGLKPAESSFQAFQGSGLLWNAGVWALSTCFSQCPHGRSLEKCVPHKNPNQGGPGKVTELESYLYMCLCSQLVLAGKWLKTMASNLQRLLPRPALTNSWHELLYWSLHDPSFCSSC